MCRLSVSWGVSDYVQGLAGDTGDLAKLVMAKEGFRDIPDVDAKLRHELSDCLWSLLVISDKPSRWRSHTAHVRCARLVAMRPGGHG